MNQFSIFDYNNRSGEFKHVFNQLLARKLNIFFYEIKDDDVLGSMALEDFVTSLGVKSIDVVSELYSKTTAGIQAGSGNQNLFNRVLGAITESWNEINK